MVPFTVEEFFGVFTAYNEAVWPAPLLLVAGALVVVSLAIRSRRGMGGSFGLVLAAMWVWMGAVYHLAFFSRINPAAYLFGVLFVAQGGLFAWAGIRRHLSLRACADVYGVTGGVFILYALAIYPLAGLQAGHLYPAAPTFGAPCPTTIFTFGLLLWADRRVPAYLLAIPFAWSLLGVSAVSAFGIIEDVGLPVAGIVGSALILWRNRQLQQRGPSYSSPRLIHPRRKATVAP